MCGELSTRKTIDNTTTPKRSEECIDSTDDDASLTKDYTTSQYIVWDAADECYWDDKHCLSQKALALAIVTELLTGILGWADSGMKVEKKWNHVWK